MHWILDNNVFKEAGYQVLIETLEKLGLPYSIHKVISFVGTLVPEAGQLLPCVASEFSSSTCEYGTKGCTTDHKNVICMGSYSMRHAAYEHGWNPGMFDLEPFHFMIQRAYWGEHMLNFDSRVVEFGDAIPCFTADHDDLMFIRPIHDSKVFAGAVMSKTEFEDWHHKVVVLEDDYGDTLTKSTLIQVASPKKIYSEHRFWVVDGKVITGSTYKLGRKVNYKQLPVGSIYQRFAEERIAEWEPHLAFCIDIADTPDGLKVIEIGTINSCGYYDANIQKLVMAFEDAFSK